MGDNDFPMIFSGDPNREQQLYQEDSDACDHHPTLIEGRCPDCGAYDCED